MFNACIHALINKAGLGTPLSRQYKDDSFIFGGPNPLVLGSDCLSIGETGNLMGVPKALLLLGLTFSLSMTS